jgi:hypothetical protein
MTIKTNNLVERLLPCPFCGFNALPMLERKKGWAVFCNNDGTLGKEIRTCGAQTGYFTTEEQAIAAWNTRDQSLSARIAVLEGEKAARERDWWKPEPGDPFYMIEAEDSEWLRNENSFLGTRDATKALRFPTAREAEKKLDSLRMIGASGTKWFYAKATEHAWIEP